MAKAKLKCLKAADLRLHYEGIGQVANLLVNPALAESTQYDRLTGYFTVKSLSAIAEGLSELYSNGGSMRLVIGLHDVPEDLLSATLSSGQFLNPNFDSFAKKFLDDVSALRAGLEKSNLEILAWLIHEKFITVKIAEPLNALSSTIFHVKRMIFSDADGHVVSATGSPNETVSGLEQNYEDLTVHFNWSTPEYTDAHESTFEAIWNNKRPDLRVYDLDPAFAKELITTLDSTRNPLTKSLQKQRPFAEFIKSVRSSAPFQIHSLTNSTLFPHQERAVIEGLSRWPVRLLLADEVGLGKTLEVGTQISALLRLGLVNRILILAPSGLMKQLQEEMALHFGLEFWRWDSGNQTFRGLNGQEYSENNSGLFKKASPSLQIISAQLARGSRKKQTFFQNAEVLPDLLVVDEAHSARLNPDNKGNLSPNLFWKLLDSISTAIPHVILLTATPMQMHPAEFHGLMQILGLRQFWNSYDIYEKSLRLIASPNNQPTLQDSAQLASMLLASMEGLDLWGLVHNEADLILLDALTSVAGQSSAKQATTVQRNFEGYKRLLVLLHPANQLVVRNTRSGLQKLGYVFPERQFKAPELQLTNEMQDFFELLEEYLDNAYGLVEQALDPKYAKSLGYVKSGYKQRLASSLAAAELSLKRRLEKVNSPKHEDIWIQEDLDEESLDIEEDERPSVRELASSPALLHAISVERLHLTQLLNSLNEIVHVKKEKDPKFVKAQTLIEESEGDSQILVFSRYVDTLNSFVKHYEENATEEQINRGFGLYTGGASWVQTQLGRINGGKKEITESLNRGDIALLFCSDAASEGLNLQAARIIINLDVPWNPARLEQRIGRIARLGQKASSVEISNLWYPASIEARMYKRLLERRDLYEVAVGEFPELFSKAITSSIGFDVSDLEGRFEYVANEVNSVRLEAQHVALSKIWDVQTQDISPSRLFISELSKFLDSAEKHFNLVPSPEMKVVNLSDDRLDQLALKDFNSNLREATLLEICCDGIVLGFGIERSKENFEAVESEKLPKLMEAIVGLAPFASNHSGLKLSKEKWAKEGDIHKTFTWLPNFSLVQNLELLVESGSDKHEQRLPLSSSIEFRELCKIWVEA